MGKQANAGRLSAAFPAVGATAMNLSRSCPAQWTQKVPKPLLFCQKPLKIHHWGLFHGEGLGKGLARQGGSGALWGCRHCSSGCRHGCPVVNRVPLGASPPPGDGTSHGPASSFVSHRAQSIAETIYNVSLSLSFSCAFVGNN